MLCGAVIMDEFFAQAGGGVVVCPGSRSAPLAYAAHARAAQGGVTVAQGGVTVAQGSVRVCPDERSAAFFALGRAKASGRAAAVVTTSGTAAANLAPALLEARHAHVPLVAFTADRPASLVGTGANQTA
ncbi:MAG: hypothetical protein LBS56_09140, partial [Propionibacteriaceae bacterium]|nr:hypothetical protein [Propionibacteriaceae bacterium]